MIVSMLEASKCLVFLSYWSFAKVHGPNIAFVENLMKARGDLDRTAVGEVMESIKRKVKDEGLTDRTLLLILQLWFALIIHDSRGAHCHEEDCDTRHVLPSTGTSTDMTAIQLHRISNTSTCTLRACASYNSKHSTCNLLYCLHVFTICQSRYPAHHVEPSRKLDVRIRATSPASWLEHQQDGRCCGLGALRQLGRSS